MKESEHLRKIGTATMMTALCLIVFVAVGVRNPSAAEGIPVRGSPGAPNAKNAIEVGHDPHGLGSRILGSAAAGTKKLSFDSEYYQVRTFTLEDGMSVDQVIISGPPIPPEGVERATVQLPEPNLVMGVNLLSDVPAFNWSFGCSATSAAMIAGYYDRTSYPNMYTGPTDGGVMPLDNSSWPDVVINGETRHQCPLSATRQGLDGRTILGHVDDYWVSYGSTAPDPFIGNWPEHTYGDCTGDYMKTNQYNYGNSDGATGFWNYTNGSPWHGTYTDDGGYGLELFYESRGYTVIDRYNQYIRGQGSDPSLGFTYDQYKAEIDAGRPVMIHVTGHTMVGLGYDDATNLMYIHDTWDYNTHTMTWGGTYSGMQHRGVTIVQLAAAPNPPGPFGKSAPSDGAPSQPANPTLQWGNSSGAESYEYCIDTTDNGACDTSWVSVGTSTSAPLSGLSPSTSYYWQVRARNTAGTTVADGGSWWGFRTEECPDLIVSQLLPSSAPPFHVGQSVNWSLRTENIGLGPAGSTVTGMYLGTSCSDLSILMGSAPIGPLPPGAHQDYNVVYTFQSGDVGTWYLSAVADLQNDEPNECDENNNTTCAGPFQVLAQCHSLTRNYTGQGDPPTADPPQSDGCPIDQFVAGESITMTPHPAQNWSLDYWDGTDGPSSSHLTMPAGNHTVTAHYAQIPCVAAVRVGSGSVGSTQGIIIPVEALDAPSPGLGAVTVDVDYDQAVVQATACSADPGGQYDSALCNVSTPGKVSLTAVSTGGVPGDSHLADITFQAVGSDGDSSLLDAVIHTFSDPSGSPIPVCDEDGLLEISDVIPGDVNCDTLVNAIDAMFILQREVGLRPNDSTTCPPPADGLFLPACDVSEDGACNAIDALFVLQCEVGIPNALCPAAFAARSVQSQLAFSNAALSAGSTAAELGESVTVPIVLASEGGEIGAATLEVGYDPAVLKVTGCTADPEGAFDSALCNADTEGRIRLTAISAAGASGQPVLAEVTFQVVGQSGDDEELHFMVETLADPTGKPIKVLVEDVSNPVGSEPPMR